MSFRINSLSCDNNILHNHKSNKLHYVLILTLKTQIMNVLCNMKHWCNSHCLIYAKIITNYKPCLLFRHLVHFCHICAKPFHDILPHLEI